MPKVYEGVIKANIIDVRFALSGKVASVSKFTGDTVKKWDVIASLDRKILQTELDRELSDYEKVRADFEVYAQKNPEQLTDIDKYLKAQKQAVLNSSVKTVELAKAKLDQTTLLSPIDGIILDDGGITAGTYTTPAGSNIKIVDTDSYYLEVEIEEKDLDTFTKPQKVKISFVSIDTKITGETKPVFADGKNFIVKIPIKNGKNIFLGLHGKAEI